MHKIKLAVVAAAASMAASLSLGAAAQASTLVFTFTEGAQTESFDLSSSTLPSGEFDDSTAPVGAGPNPYYTNVSGIGADKALDTFQNVTFYSLADGGGVVAGLAPGGGGLPTYFEYVGDQLYAGSPLAPSFVPGVYQLSDPDNQSAAATLTISATPEPSTWALLIAGVAMVGGMLRSDRRRRVGGVAAV